MLSAWADKFMIPTTSNSQLHLENKGIKTTLFSEKIKVSPVMTTSTKQSPLAGCLTHDSNPGHLAAGPPSHHQPHPTTDFVAHRTVSVHCSHHYRPLQVLRLHTRM